jgi:hypothetical protein
MHRIASAHEVSYIKVLHSVSYIKVPHKRVLGQVVVMTPTIHSSAAVKELGLEMPARISAGFTVLKAATVVWRTPKCRFN